MRSKEGERWKGQKILRVSLQQRRELSYLKVPATEALGVAGAGSGRPVALREVCDRSEGRDLPPEVISFLGWCAGVCEGRFLFTLF